MTAPDAAAALAEALRNTSAEVPGHAPARYVGWEVAEDRATDLADALAAAGYAIVPAATGETVARKVRLEALAAAIVEYDAQTHTSVRETGDLDAVLEKWRIVSALAHELVPNPSLAFAAPRLARLPEEGPRLVSIEQVSDALNSELDDTDGGNDLVAAVLTRLEARTSDTAAEGEQA